jgi:hypothetical protein
MSPSGPHTFVWRGLRCLTWCLAHGRIRVGRYPSFGAVHCMVHGWVL